MGRCVMPGQGGVGSGKAGSVFFGLSVRSVARQGRLGPAWRVVEGSGVFWKGQARQGRQCEARCPVRCVPVWQCKAGMARQGKSWYGSMRRGLERQGKAGLAGRCPFRYGMARKGKAGEEGLVASSYGKARTGRARQAWSGDAQACQCASVMCKAGLAMCVGDVQMHVPDRNGKAGKDARC